MTAYLHLPHLHEIRKYQLVGSGPGSWQEKTVKMRFTLLTVEGQIVALFPGHIWPGNETRADWQWYVYTSNLNSTSRHLEKLYALLQWLGHTWIHQFPPKRRSCAKEEENKSRYLTITVVQHYYQKLVAMVSVFVNNTFTCVRVLLFMYMPYSTKYCSRATYMYTSSSYNPSLGPHLLDVLLLKPGWSNFQKRIVNWSCDSCAHTGSV